jgi:hypothetical protein
MSGAKYKKQNPCNHIDLYSYSLKQAPELPKAIRGIFCRKVKAKITVKQAMRAQKEVEV